MSLHCTTAVNILDRRAATVDAPLQLGGSLLLALLLALVLLITNGGAG